VWPSNTATCPPFRRYLFLLTFDPPTSALKSKQDGPLLLLSRFIQISRWTEPITPFRAMKPFPRHLGDPFGKLDALLLGSSSLALLSEFLRGRRRLARDIILVRELEARVDRLNRQVSTLGDEILQLVQELVLTVKLL